MLATLTWWAPSTSAASKSMSRVASEAVRRSSPGSTNQSSRHSTSRSREPVVVEDRAHLGERVLLEDVLEVGMPDPDPREPDALRLLAAVAEVEEAPLAPGVHLDRPGDRPVQPDKFVHLRPLLGPGRRRTPARDACRLLRRAALPSLPGARTPCCARGARSSLSSRRAMALQVARRRSRRRRSSASASWSCRAARASARRSTSTRCSRACRPPAREHFVAVDRGARRARARRRGGARAARPLARLPRPARARVRGLLQRLRRSGA